MFRWSDLVPFEEGEPFAVRIAKGVLSATGTGRADRIGPDELVLSADLPRQAIVFPATRLRYRYRLGAPDQASLVEATWNGRAFRDAAARIEPGADGASVRVSARFAGSGGGPIAFRMVRGGRDRLDVLEVTGHPLVAGGRLEMVRTRGANPGEQR